MSEGYIPLFDGLTKGSLQGKWPDIGLWPILLSLTDGEGILKATYGHIAFVTGMPVQQVIDCIERFCEPDPDSGSPEEEGRRMLKQGAHCWLVVNRAKYRRKAVEADAIEKTIARAENERAQSRERMRKLRSGVTQQKRNGASPSVTENGVTQQLRPVTVRSESLFPPASPPMVPPQTPPPISPPSNPLTLSPVEIAVGPKRGSRFVPKDFKVTADMREWAERECPDVDHPKAVALWRDHQYPQGMLDWKACFRTWMSRAQGGFGPLKKRKGFGQ